MFNTLRLRQNGRHFPDDIFKRIFLNENVWIPIKISLKFVPKGPIKNIPALVQIRRQAIIWSNDSLLMHICITRPQWVKSSYVAFLHHWVNVMICNNITFLESFIHMHEIFVFCLLAITEVTRHLMYQDSHSYRNQWLRDEQNIWYQNIIY